MSAIDYFRKAPIYCDDYFIHILVSYATEKNMIPQYEEAVIQFFRMLRSYGWSLGDRELDKFEEDIDEVLKTALYTEEYKKFKLNFRELYYRSEIEMMETEDITV
jgi:hypothetical protein